jgi:hypothetical protein
MKFNQQIWPVFIDGGTFLAQLCLGRVCPLELAKVYKLKKVVDINSIPLNKYNPTQDIL